jgi:hypothetical protein
VEFNGVWWNGTCSVPPYIDYNEIQCIGLADWIGGIFGVVALLV